MVIYSTRTFLLLLVILSSHILFAQQKKYTASDIATDIPVPYQYDKNNKKIDLQTYYISMRDGVQLAIDVYLPKGLKKGEKIPALLHQTRYWRAPQLRWPINLFSDGLIGRQGQFIKQVVNNGYAIVNVDARGSGASFGNRAYPWTADETKDGAEIVDWIIKQDWSNTIVGTLGVSYSGTTAEFLLHNQHPNVKAAILLYSLYDVFDDIAFPGGIFHNSFVLDWGYFNSQLDKDLLPRSSFIAKRLVKGVRRVKTNQRTKKLKNALVDHEQNLNVDESSKGVEFRDQAPENGVIETMDIFSPHVYIDKINETNVPVYSYSGWMDGDYQHANIKRFVNLTNPDSKLIIGPWEHSGGFNCSPANPGKAGFDHVGEFLKFFDFHLKGKQNGLDKEPRIHYFTMMEEKWKSADNWPPIANESIAYFSDNNQLSFDAPTTEKATDSYKVDTTAVTSRHSRWRSLIGDLSTPKVYPNRTEEDKKLLCYTSQPLASDTEITGHPIITLYLSSDQKDGNFHVYLEEVEPNGKVTYVTEGLLRGIHRKLADGFPTYKDVVPQRTYLQADVLPLVPGEVAELKFDLLPTSYLFKKGNSIRIAIAGADRNHFKVMHKSEPNLTIYRSKEYPSNVVLPIVKR